MLKETLHLIYLNYHHHIYTLIDSMLDDIFNDTDFDMSKSQLIHYIYNHWVGIDDDTLRELFKMNHKRTEDYPWVNEVFNDDYFQNAMQYLNE